jgi:arylsulfatase A-like enzyme
MSRIACRLAVFCALAAASFALRGTASHAAETRPNIVMILADDLGYGDLGCYGQKRIQTPRIDRMAKEGVRFTDFYAGCTVCAPSRCVLMTGYHTGHAHIRGNAGRERPEIQILRDQDLTAAEVLKKAGYATALCGKWGLGDEGTVGTPNKQGFDYFFGYLNQGHAHNYYPAFLFKNEDRFPLKNVVPGEGRFGSGVATQKVEYSADLITAEALKWIEEHREQQFFLYYTPTIPHANNEGKNDGMEVPDLGQYANTDWPANQKAHAAMISRLDADVGKLLDLLKKLGLDEKTLVLFSSDNGPHQEGGNDPQFNDSNGPLQGIKRDLTEGGIRVPFIARWPGQIAAGTTSAFAGGFQDFLPTAAELVGAGSSVPSDCDGLSIVPTLHGTREKQKQHELLFWTFYERGGGRASRSGNWKAIQQPLNSPVRLYNLAKDIGEEYNLAAEQPAVVADLTKKMDAAYVPHENWKFPQPGAGGNKAGPKAKAASKQAAP